MIENGYKSNECDKCIYYKTWENSHVIISLYVDDLLILGSNLHVINEIENILRSHFDMKDLGETNFILGMKITKTCDGIYLKQSYYIEKILKKYNYHDCKHVVTPFDSSVHLFPINNDNDIVNQKEYASIIGSLRYATDCTRLDIAYAVGVLSRFTSKNILLYLKVSLMLTGILCQVILYLPLVTFLLWVVVQYVGNLKNKLLLLTLLWRLSL